MTVLRLFTAGICLVSVLVAAGARGENAQEITAKAKQHFAAGIAHVDDPSGPNFEDAYREFRAAYAENPLHHIALNIGYCAYYLERDGEALEMLETFLAHASDREIPTSKRTQLEKDVLVLRAGLVHVTIRVSPTRAMLIDERLLPQSTTVVNRYSIEHGSLDLGIHPGHHRFTISSMGFDSKSVEFEAEPGSGHSYEFALVQADKALGLSQLQNQGSAARTAESGQSDWATVTSSRHLIPDAQLNKRDNPSIMVILGAGTTVALTAAGIGVGLLSNARKREFHAANDGTQIKRAEHLRSETKAYAMAADMCLTAAALSAGATLYSFLSRTPHSTEAPPSAWRLFPSIGRSRAAVELVGDF